MPYRVPACALRIIGTSTTTLPRVIVATAKDAALTLDREEMFLPYQYFLIFRK